MVFLVVSRSELLGIVSLRRTGIPRADLFHALPQEFARPTQFFPIELRTRVAFIIEVFSLTYIKVCVIRRERAGDVAPLAPLCSSPPHCSGQMNLPFWHSTPHVARIIPSHRFLQYHSTRQPVLLCVDVRMDPTRTPSHRYTQIKVVGKCGHQELLRSTSVRFRLPGSISTIVNPRTPHRYPMRSCPTPHSRVYCLSNGSTYS